MSKTTSTPAPQGRSLTTILLLAGLVILTLAILLSYVTFFAINATQWTPVPTYTATFNATQAAQATSVAQTLTPPPTNTTVAPASMASTAPATTGATAVATAAATAAK